MFRFIGPNLSRSIPTRGFSLVEVLIAVGIVSFALLSIVSLIPVGLVTFQKGMQISISEQIIQKVVSDAQQTDYSTLVDLADWTGNTAPASFRGPTISAPALRYFDAQGDELFSSTGSIFQVNTIIVPQAVYYPISGTATTLSTTVLVKVEVAVNPANLTLTYVSNSIKATAGMPVYRGVTLVAQSR